MVYISVIITHTGTQTNIKFTGLAYITKKYLIRKNMLTKYSFWMDVRGGGRTAFLLLPGRSIVKDATFN